MKIAFFDAKPYDKPSFDKYGAKLGLDIKYFETKLNEDTVELGLKIFYINPVLCAVLVKGRLVIGLSVKKSNFHLFFSVFSGIQYKASAIYIIPVFC